MDPDRVLPTFEMLNPQSLLEGALDRSISQMPGMYVRTPSTLRFTQGRISFKLNLGKDVDKFPDPTIKIDGSFGLDVEDGNLVSRSATAVADVGPSPDGHGCSRALFRPPAVHHQRRGTGTPGPVGALDTIASMTNLLAFLWVTADGMRRHSVRIDVHDDGSGMIELTECPEEALRRLVKET